MHIPQQLNDTNDFKKKHNLFLLDMSRPLFNLRNGIIGCISILVILLVTFLISTTTSTKSQFLNRFNQLYNTRQLSQKYTLSISNHNETYDLINMDNIKISGNATRDGDNYSTTIKVQGFEDFGFTLPKIVLKSIDNKDYINLNIVTEYLQTMIKLYGFTNKEMLQSSKSEYTELNTAFNVIFKNPNNGYYKTISSPKQRKALQHEISNTISNELKNLKSSKFKKSGKDRELILSKSDITDIIEKVLNVIQSSENYVGDKKELKSEIKKLKEQYRNEMTDYKLSISIKLGQDVGDSITTIKYNNPSYGDNTITFSTKKDTFVKPSKPKTIISEKELNNRLNNITKEHTKSLYE